MTSGWSIDAKSIASVKKQTDKIKALRLTVKQTFATMGDRVSSDVLKALDRQMQLKHSDTKISELVDVSTIATGHARFRVEVTGKEDKGKLLMSGRKKTSGLILPRKGKGMKVRKNDPNMAGKVLRQARKVRVPGRSDEMHEIAIAVVKGRMAERISHATGLGIRGGGAITRGQGGWG
jgi:hypothetical protein